MKRLRNKSPDELNAILFAANNGGDACDAINALAKLANKGNKVARKALAAYVTLGPIQHMRQHACAGLAESFSGPDGEFAETFRHGMADNATRYWSLLGLINVVGKDAYPDLVKVAEDVSLRMEDRSQAVKCLAKLSKQEFDRGLPIDPGLWKEEQFRLAEVRSWAESGYHDGVEYAPPLRHPALDKPISAFENIVSRLDKKLARQRKKRQDLADPTDWLTPGLPADIERIKRQWNLPPAYVDFLTRFSPLKVILESRRYVNGGLWLFGAGELIASQDGYLFNTVEQKPLEDWPAQLVVIASHAGDPFVLDLAKSDGNGAPVDTAKHGAGVWEFERVAGSFEEFLKQLVK